MIPALRYEWRRLITLRSTWILLLLATATTVLLALLQVSLAEDFAGIDGRAPIDLVIDNAHNPISLTLISVVTAMTFGHEYRYGLVRLTLTSLPRRGRVFLAKTLISAVYAFVAYGLGLLASFATAYAFGDERVRFRSLTARTRNSSDADLGQWSSVLWEDLVRAAGYVVLYSLIAMAIALLLRNLALGVIIPLIASTLVEPLLLGFLETRALWLNDVLPFTNGALFLDWSATGDPITTSGSAADPLALDYATGNPITPPRAGLVFTAWTAMLLASAYALFETRDA
jgi:ABC-2 type transport system permease protein